MWVIISFILGLVVGSFLNVCIYRLPRSGMSILKPASHCPVCLHPIKWYDNIPLLSYLFLRGKCRYCQTTISLRYPLVELLTAVLFALAAYAHPYGLPIEVGLSFQKAVIFIVKIYLLAILIIATFIDLEFRIIPDEITISGIILAPLFSFFFPYLHDPLPFFQLGSQHLNSLMASLAGMLTGGGIIYLVGLLGKLIFRKEAMGLGDVKLMVFFGGFLGWESVIFIFFLGCIFGSIIGIISWIITKDRYIAFGPYLALGAILMIFLKKQIIYLACHSYPEFIRHFLSPMM